MNPLEMPAHDLVRATRTRQRLGTLLGVGALAACVVGISAWILAPRDARPTMRTYYIAADEVEWDYVPGTRNGITGQPFVDTAWTAGGPHPVSTRYVKALYREYTDSAFTTLKPRPPEWAHLGFLGPLLRAEVGDTIRVVFRNNVSFPAGMHPHGVFYDKSSEGAPYDDGTAGDDRGDDGVPPGGTHVYVWPVPERAGPGPGDRNSVLWMYHSHTDEIRDVSAGLQGPIIVTARGAAKADGTPKGVDRELILAFAQTHEEWSWYADRNISALTTSATSDDPVTPPNPPHPALFPYYVRYSINGYDHGGMPLAALTVRKGEHVRWYLFASTGDIDFHTPHWHGNTVLDQHMMRTDVVSLQPMSMLVADMIPDNVGTWLIHCHVADHLWAGMQARYAVVNRVVER